jgi:hypothetical protein
MFVPLMVGLLFESFGPRVMIFIVLLDLIVALAVYLLLVLGSNSNYRTKLRQQEHTA